MIISDIKLCFFYGKLYFGLFEIIDFDLVLYGIQVRVNLVGILKNVWIKMGLCIEGYNVVFFNFMWVEVGLGSGQWQDG